MPVSTKIIERDHVDDINNFLKTLKNRRVLVGIPERTNTRTEPSGRTAVLGNAALGYIHERGSAAQGIPPRPFLVPGVSKSLEKWLPNMRKAAEHALEGDMEKCDLELERAGQKAVNAVVKTIKDKIPPPLKPGTIIARRRKSRIAGRPLPGESKMAAARRAAGVTGVVDGRATIIGGDVTPLWDTGDLIRSITFTVEKK
jgi:hypothetical protein